VIAAEAAQTELDRLSVPERSPEDLNAEYTAAAGLRELSSKSYGRPRPSSTSSPPRSPRSRLRADAFMAGAKGLVEARRTLKAFLAPSLSRVASKLISEMTVNARAPLE
jgi:hypothetical protein